MAKNKAVFGIYRSQAGVEKAVGMLRVQTFSNSDVAVLLPESLSDRELGTERPAKRRKVRRPERVRERCWGECLDGWLELGRLPFPVWAHSSQPAPSWLHLLAWVWVAQ